MAIECWVCGGGWWLGPKWAKHFGEVHQTYSNTVSIPKIPTVEETAADALMVEILEAS